MYSLYVEAAIITLMLALLLFVTSGRLGKVLGFCLAAVAIMLIVSPEMFPMLH
jgi:hypothetical protein